MKIDLYTYQMIGLADENGKTYECEYGTYSKESRFIFNDRAGEVFERDGYRELFDILVHEDLWKLKQEPIKKMTLTELEKELGYRVQIVDPEPEKKEVSEDRRKDVDNTIDVFRRIFGIELDPNDYY